MNKIIPLILFIPLLFLSIYLGYIQYANSKTNSNINKNTNTNTNTNISTNKKVEKEVHIETNSATPTPSSILSTINLVLSSPESGSTVNGASVTVSGTTKPKIDVVVNYQELLSGMDGSFKTLVSLDEGENYISVVAFDEEGNVAEREIVVTRSMSLD